MNFPDEQLRLFKHICANRALAHFSDQRLGDELGISVRSVKRYMKGLRDLGLIETKTTRYLFGDKWFNKRQIFIGAQKWQ
jgi:predicted transcriptional regulator